MLTTLLDDLLAQFWKEGVLVLFALVTMARTVLSGVYRDVYLSKIGSGDYAGMQVLMISSTILFIVFLVWILEPVFLLVFFPNIIDITVSLVMALMLSHGIVYLLSWAVLTQHYFLRHVLQKWLLH